MLKYFSGRITDLIVPDEHSLEVVISGCIHKCPDCHSKYSWPDEGRPLLEHLPIMLKEYAKYVSCVCFMGGDHDQQELMEACNQVHKAGLKTCLYTGYEEMSQINLRLLDELDYIKLGRFDKTRGPLKNPNTNQRMYRKVKDWEDITYKFWPDIDLL